MGVWTEKADMPQANFLGACGVYGNEIYYIGGGRTGSESRQCFVYHALVDSWSTLPDLPEAKAGAKCIATEEEIYLFGGSTDTYHTASVYIFNKASKTWRQGDSMPAEVPLYGCHRKGDKVYCLSDGFFSRPIMVYSLQSGTWSTESVCPPLRQFGSACIGDTIYCMGAFGVPNSQEDLDIYAYNTLARDWSVVGQMPESRESFVCEAVGNYIYVIGGYLYNNASDATLVFDTASATWSTDEAEMPSPVYTPSSAVYDHKIFIMGGSEANSGNLVQRVFMYVPAEAPDENEGGGEDSCAKVKIQITGCSSNKLVQDVCKLVQESGADCDLSCEID